MIDSTPSSEPEPAPDVEPDETPLASDLIESLRVEIRRMTRSAYVLTRAAVDRARLSVRRMLFFAAAGLLGSVVAVSLLVKASLVFLDGLAAGLSILCGDRAWMGSLLAGLFVLGVVAAGFAWLRHSASRRFHERILRRYGPAPAPAEEERTVKGAA